MPDPLEGAIPDSQPVVTSELPSAESSPPGEEPDLNFQPRQVVASEAPAVSVLPLPESLTLTAPPEAAADKGAPAAPLRDSAAVRPKKASPWPPTARIERASESPPATMPRPRLPVGLGESGGLETIGRWFTAGGEPRVVRAVEPNLPVSGQSGASADASPSLPTTPPTTGGGGLASASPKVPVSTVEVLTPELSKLEARSVRQSVEQALERAAGGRRPVVRAAPLPPPPSSSSTTAAGPQTPSSPLGAGTSVLPGERPVPPEAVPMPESGAASRGAAAASVPPRGQAGFSGTPGRPASRRSVEPATAQRGEGFASPAPSSGAARVAASGPAGGVVGTAAPLVEQIAARIARLLPGQSVTITLDPVELGKVAIRFVRRGKRWKVQLVAERSDTAALLARDVQRLDSLVDRNLPGTRVEVSTGGHSQGQFHDGPGGQPSAERGGHFAPPAENSEPGSTRALSTASPGIDPDARLDILG